MSKLSEMQVGDIAQIKGYSSGHSAYCGQLLSMGLTPNTVFTLVHRAPLGDPVQIQVRDTLLSLRQAEANLLDICLSPCDHHV